MLAVSSQYDLTSGRKLF